VESGEDALHFGRAIIGCPNSGGLTALSPSNPTGNGNGNGGCGSGTCHQLVHDGGENAPNRKSRLRNGQISIRGASIEVGRWEDGGWSWGLFGGWVMTRERTHHSYYTLWLMKVSRCAIRSSSGGLEAGCMADAMSTCYSGSRHGRAHPRHHTSLDRIAVHPAEDYGSRGFKRVIIQLHTLVCKKEWKGNSSSIEALTIRA
jgi:hypothetical protein